jgi:ribosomal protein S4
MANIDPEKSSRVEQAQGRLDEVVTRLERALVRRGEGDARLAERLSAAEAENKTLRETNTLVERRLDTVIDRLKTVLKK